jgi:hypothetical protein
VHDPRVETSFAVEGNLVPIGAVVVEAGCHGGDLKIKQPYCMSAW